MAAPPCRGFNQTPEERDRLKTPWLACLVRFGGGSSPAAFRSVNIASKSLVSSPPAGPTQ